MEPGEIHITDKVVDGATFRVLFLPYQFIDAVARDMGFTGAPHLSIAHTRRADLFSAFYKFHRLIDSGRIDEAERESQLISCVGDLLTNCAERRPEIIKEASSSAMNRTKEILHERFRENVSLDELSRSVGLSKFHLLRSFVARFGFPPHAYQIQVRLSKAREFMAKGELASHLDLGFSDQSHFIRHFKKSMGMTPLKYSMGRWRPFSGATP